MGGKDPLINHKFVINTVHERVFVQGPNPCKVGHTAYFLPHCSEIKYKTTRKARV